MATSLAISTGRPTLVGNQSDSLRESYLVSAAKRGQHSAFAELCERYAKRIFHVALRITRNREDAQDAVQDSFLSAFLHLGKFDGRSSFYTWLMRIAINAALMKIRKNRSYREVSMDDSSDPNEKPLPHEFADSAPNPEERYVQRERERIVNAAVRELRPAIRRAVEIRQLQECSMNETAEALGISLAAAKGRLFQARLALRKAAAIRTMANRRGRRAA